MNNNGMSISSFFFAYVIPKRKLSKSIDKAIDQKSIQDSLMPLLNEYLKHKAPKSGKVALIAFNRFFDARMAFHLNLEQELRSLLVEQIEADHKLPEKIFNQKVTVVDAEPLQGLLDYIDLSVNQELPMDKIAHFFILPIFVLSSVPGVNPTSELFSIFKSKEFYKDVVIKIQNSQLSGNIAKLISNDVYYCGLFENESFVSKYILDLKPQMSNLSP
jgi:hypothetical protein